MTDCAGHMTAGRCLRPKATRSVAFWTSGCFWSVAKEAAEAVQLILLGPSNRWMTAPIWNTLIASTRI